MSDTFGGRTVVVSPHLDDAIFSLGATIAHTTSSGGRVEVLTVFAGNPSSEARAGSWDERAGFRSEGEASRARREEDARACAVVGATPVWLPFGDSQYDRHGGRRRIRKAIYSAVAEADTVLLPGFPFRHGDHAWVTETVLRGRVGSGRVGLYVEQPYALKRRDASIPSDAPELLRSLPALLGPSQSITVGDSELRAKWNAIGEYASQLAISRVRDLRAKLVAEREAFAWLPAGLR